MSIIDPSKSAAAAAEASEAMQKSVQGAFRKLKDSNYPTIRPLLPLLFSLKGKPYSISEHVPFEPMYRSRRPQKIMFKTGRQVTKSTSIAVDGVAMSLCIPDFSTLFVTPLHAQIRRFSSNYVRPFIDESPVRHLMVDTSCDTSVSQRSFINRSKMIFSFAFLSADRTRGISCDKMAVDELQDFDPEFIKIIRETMSHSVHKVEQYTGTPKTYDNVMETMWNQGSGAEWAIKCHACGYWSIPSMGQDLDRMIGPDHPDIGPRRPGVVCGKCQKPIFPQEHGRWLHAKEGLKMEFEGYHVPQIILPLHYSSRKSWKLLLGKRDGAGMTDAATFYNEVLGESYDQGAKLITLTDIRKAATLHPREYRTALANRKKYIRCVLGVDWGGGGEKGISYTTFAVVGMLPDGKMECFYGHRSPYPHDHYREAVMTRTLFEDFECSHVAHDYNGAGSLRETIAVHQGLPESALVPMAYSAITSKGLMTHNPPGVMRQRGYYTLDKSRTLMLVCECVKQGHLRFFHDDYVDQDNTGLLRDFLALVEDKMHTKGGIDIYRITSSGSAPCDFADSVNFACCCIWHQTGKYPDLAQVQKYGQLTSELRKELLDTDAMRGELA